MGVLGPERKLLPVRPGSNLSWLIPIVRLGAGRCGELPGSRYGGA